MPLLATLGFSTFALDKTDCFGVVLDDSAFTEAIVRDHRDESYGALSNNEVRPLGEVRATTRSCHVRQ